MTLKRTAPDLVPYPQWEVECLSDYVEFLEICCTKEDALFRGQAEDWALRPKLGRLRVPPGRSLPEIEEEMLSHFERTVVAHLSSPPVSRWELCALAQHHGMATRLLDWTYNPLAALWFSLDGSSSPSAPNAVVWMFCPDASDLIGAVDFSPAAITSICCWKPRHVSPRIRAQGGVFTVHPFTANLKNFQPLQESSDHIAKLAKILVPAAALAGIRYQLDRCGINAASVYPDVDGLARHIEWLYSYGYCDDKRTGGKRGYGVGGLDNGV